MKRNLLLISGILISIVLIFNSSRRILSLRTTSGQVTQAQEKLEEIRKENENLKRELEYKQSQQFQEAEIRNKLGLVKEGETVVIVPKEDVDGQSTIDDSQQKIPNWQKWKELLLGKE